MPAPASQEAPHVTPAEPASKLTLKILGLAAAYFVTGKLGLLLAIPPGYATAIWPPSGIALAGILILGYRVWPGILLGSFLVNVSTSLDVASPTTIIYSMALPLAIGSGAALQGVVGAFLVRRFAKFPNALASEKEVFSFLLFGGLVGNLVNATIAVSALLVSGQISPSNFIPNWGTWWIGDAMGVFIFTPLVLAWTLRPRESWRERRMMLSIPVAIAFFLTVVVVHFGAQSERERLRLYFDQHAFSVASALEKALSGYMGVLRSLESFHKASANIDRDEFKAFTERYLTDFPSLQALSWNPRILDSGREAFEEATRDEGFPAFEISERGADGQLARATKRPKYIVVHYIEPFEANKAALGFDVYSNPTRREALDQARDSGEPVSTGRITLVQETGKQAGVLVFQPIYRNGRPHQTVEERQQNLQGYMVGVLRMADVLNAFMKGLEMDGISHRLLDISASAGEQQLYECENSRKGVGFVLEENGLFGGTTRLRKNISVPFGQRQWQLQIEAGQDFFARHHSENTWLILFAGFLLTGLIGAFVLVVSGRGGMLRSLVAERTAELERSNGELKQFSYAVSHDLQEPLRAVSNFLTLLERRYAGKVLDEKAEQYIGFAVGGAKRMSDMIRDLLEYSRVQTRVEEAEPTDIGQVVHAAIDNLSVAIGEARAEVTVGSELPIVWGNHGQLTRVFQNLIGNGIKYRDPTRPPKISVVANSVGRAWVFSVADNGIGVEPAYFDRIFGVFQRLHARDEYEGTGIGLALVKRIIEQHGGRIWLESEVGKGSTFKFTLGTRGVK